MIVAIENRAPIKLSTVHDFSECFTPFEGEGPAEGNLLSRTRATVEAPSGEILLESGNILHVRGEDGRERIAHYRGGNVDHVVDFDPSWRDVRLISKEPLLERHEYFRLSVLYAYMQLARGLLTLHASAIRHRGEAILFAGPSGSGKSTQARLWQEAHPGKIDILNDDKPLLDPASARAYGTPFAGTSRKSLNASAPIRAIVLVEPRSRDDALRLGRADAAARLYALAIRPDHDAEGMHRFFHQLEKLLDKVPIYRLCCTPTPQAVSTLKAALEKETRQ